MDIIIRPATDQDRPAVAHIHTASWQQAYRGILSDDYLAHQVKHDLYSAWCDTPPQQGDSLLIALRHNTKTHQEAQNNPIGFIALWARPDVIAEAGSPLVEALHILPDQKGQGIGRALLQEGATLLSGAGFHAMHLWVLVANKPALAFYEKLGAVFEGPVDKRLHGKAEPHYKATWHDLRPLIARG